MPQKIFRFQFRAAAQSKIQNPKSKIPPTLRKPQPASTIRNFMKPSDSTPHILHTETPDPTPDTGPRLPGDTRTWFYTIVLAIAAITLTAVGIRVVPYISWIPLLALGIPAAYGVWCIYTTHRDRAPDAPRSHSILAGELGFDLIATCRGVAATAFFMPDSVNHGGATRLYLFLENYMSRQRVVTARFGHLPGIGRPRATLEHLHLAAGQAAVYSFPVQAGADIPSGFHRLSVTLRVQQPEGVGQRLQGARTRIPDMHILRFAAPFEVAQGRPETAAQQPLLAAPRYISLASVTEKDPPLARLYDLIG